MTAEKDCQKLKEGTFTERPQKVFITVAFKKYLLLCHWKITFIAKSPLWIKHKDVVCSSLAHFEAVINQET